MTNYKNYTNHYSYDVTQYESFPYKQTHPNHLYTLGTLFGLKPKPFQQARILELGCAAGGNLIPMAYSAPQSHCVGIDLSAKQIEDGLKTVDALCLKNIELRHQSILDFHKSEGEFDYIICHGLYAWVNRETQNKILQICQENLSEHGIAFISYNTLPGWNMVRSIRDMMKYHVNGFTEPKEKASQARSILQFIQTGIKDQKTPYTQFLESEINLLSKQSDNYLLHDHLEDDNNPVYFYEFVEHAKGYQLSYLSDTDIAQMFPANLPPALSQEISKITDIVRLGQYMDFVRNQRFRQTLLCHANVTINRNLQTHQVMDYSLKFEGIVEGDESVLAIEHMPIVYKGSFITLTLKNHLTKIALWILTKQRKPIAYRDWVNLVLKETKIQDRNRIQQILNEELNIMRLVLGGLIALSSDSHNYAITPTKNPKTTSLIQHQLNKSNLVTNQRHEVVRLNTVEKILLKLCNGSIHQKHLGRAFAESLIIENVSLYKEDGTVISNKEDVYRRSEYLVQDMLNLFAHNALLIDA